MKKSISLSVIAIFTLLSCEKFNTVDFSNPVLKIDQNQEYSFNDFELYDSSTHMLYFKASHPELIDPNQSKFTFFADSTLIYQGNYHSGFLSSLPSGPFIWKFPFFYPNYTIRFEFMGQGIDPRNDDRLISAFKNKKLLHSGLSGEIKDILMNESQLTFSFKITNKDQSDLLILDSEKMGQNLFHYFTNAPVFYNISQNKVFEYNFEYETPSPHDMWSVTWLSELNSGDSRIFTFTYNVDGQFPPGDYKIYFEFPGLSNQITRDQLFQENKRIWLGDIMMIKYLKIN